MTWNTQEEERLMREAFNAQVAEVIADPERFNRLPEERYLGFESELGLVGSSARHTRTDGERAGRLLAQLIEQGNADGELGLTQLELRTKPHNLADGWQALCADHAAAYENARETLAGSGFALLRAGANPFLATTGVARNTTKERYISVPDANRAWRRPEVDTSFGLLGAKVDIGDTGLPALMNAFHPNLQAPGLKEAVRWMNRSFGISPCLVALAANARYLMDDQARVVDTGWQDGRLPAWEVSHDTRTTSEAAQGLRTRIGLPEGYFPNVRSYFDRIRRFPFIIGPPERAMAIGIGLHWLDARVKLLQNGLGDRAVVELRSLSTQPAVEDEMALALFWVGRLQWAERNQEELLPFDKVRQNRTEAQRKGMRAELWVQLHPGHLKKLPASTAVQIEYGRAWEGLSQIGLSDDDGLLDEFVQERLYGSPSEKMAMVLRRKSVLDPEEVYEAMRRFDMIS